MESGDSDSSSNAPGAETCAICLGRMRGEVGSPDSCEHIFCLICILEWAKVRNACNIFLPNPRVFYILIKFTVACFSADSDL